MPARLTVWHAPRANRWERLCVLAGEWVTEWLDTAGVSTRRFVAEQTCWIEPGCRWRIAELGDAAFELEIHADETVAAAEPLASRAAMGRDRRRAHPPAYGF